MNQTEVTIRACADDCQLDREGGQVANCVGHSWAVVRHEQPNRTAEGGIVQGRRGRGYYVLARSGRVCEKHRKPTLWVRSGQVGHYCVACVAGFWACVAGHTAAEMFVSPPFVEPMGEVIDFSQGEEIGIIESLTAEAYNRACEANNAYAVALAQKVGIDTITRQHTSYSVVVLG